MGRGGGRSPPVFHSSHRKFITGGTYLLGNGQWAMDHELGSWPRGPPLFCHHFNFSLKVRIVPGACQQPFKILNPSNVIKSSGISVWLGQRVLVGSFLPVPLKKD